jgi:hypothetical protein
VGGAKGRKTPDHLAGNLTLNYVRVRWVADIDLAALEGKRYLEDNQRRGEARYR